MKKKDLIRFADRLREEKSRILSGPARIRREELQLSQDDLADEADLASSGLTQSINIRLRDRETLLLKKIETALSKIDRGEFGVCEACEEPIEAKRLDARPMADMCVGCKEIEEQVERTLTSAPLRATSAND